MWSIGAMIECDDRVKFQEFLIKNSTTIKLDLPSIELGQESIFDYLVDQRTAKWIHWKTKVEHFMYPKTGPQPDYAGILVPNVDNVRIEYLIDLIAKQSKSVLLIGEQVGKF